MLITDFISALEQIVPLAAVGFERDAVGLQVGWEQGTKLKKVLIAYEVTAEVIEEAIAEEANLILAFHPLIFPTISAVTDSTRTGKLVRQLIKNEIGLYVQHTAFDTHTEFGTSQLMADVLELNDVEPLVPLRNTLNKITVFAPYNSMKLIKEALAATGAGRIGDTEAYSFQIEGRGQFKSKEILPEPGGPTVLEGVDEVRLEMVCERWNTEKAIRALCEAHPNQNLSYDITPISTDSRNHGMGAVGNWGDSLSREQTLKLVSEAFGTTVLRYNQGGPQRIRRVAMVGGAGMEFYSSARSSKVDAYITADVRYHDFYRADHDGLLLIDAGHAETEKFVTRGMAQAAKRAMERLAERTSEQFGAREGTANPALDALSVPLAIARTEPNSVRYYCDSVKPAVDTSAGK